MTPYQEPDRFGLSSSGFYCRECKITGRVTASGDSCIVLFLSCVLGTPETAKDRHLPAFRKTFRHCCRAVTSVIPLLFSPVYST